GWGVTPPRHPGAVPTAGALRVTQDPGEVQVTAGDRVALGCQVEVAEPWEKLRIEWMKDGGQEALCATRLEPATPVPPAPCAPRAPHLHLAWQPPRATLSLPRAR
ncbi:TMIG2 protein, partial [Calyptomena viridis]|nr:TMIG2 protein [Calyptomena viridis]